MQNTWPLKYGHTTKTGEGVDGGQGCVWCWKMDQIEKTLEDKMGDTYSRQWVQQRQVQGWFLFIEGINELIPGKTLPLSKAVPKVTHMGSSDDSYGPVRKHLLKLSHLTLLSHMLLHQNLYRTSNTHWTTFSFKNLNVINRYHILCFK